MKISTECIILTCPPSQVSSFRSIVLLLDIIFLTAMSLTTCLYFSRPIGQECFLVRFSSSTNLFHFQCKVSCCESTSCAYAPSCASSTMLCTFSDHVNLPTCPFGISDVTLVFASFLSYSSVCVTL